MDQKQLTVTVNKMYKDGQHVVSESSKETPIDVGLFQTATATVSVQATHTKNLGNYQSLKIGVIVSVPTYVEELDDAHDFAVQKVSEYLNAELKALDGDTVEPVELTEGSVPLGESTEVAETPAEEPKKRGRKKKEVVEEEDHIPTFDTAPTENSVENPTPVDQVSGQVSDQVSDQPKETVVEEQEISASMLRNMDYESLVGIVEANDLKLELSAYTNTEDGRKALAEDIIDLAFPEEQKKDAVDATDVLTGGEAVTEPEPAKPVEETQVEAPVVEEPVAETPAEEPVAQENVENSDETPYTFEELSDYTDEELHQVYEYWGLGEFPEKRSMAIKRILEVQEKGL